MKPFKTVFVGPDTMNFSAHGIPAAKRGQVIEITEIAAAKARVTNEEHFYQMFKGTLCDKDGNNVLCVYAPVDSPEGQKAIKELEAKNKPAPDTKKPTVPAQPEGSK